MSVSHEPGRGVGVVRPARRSALQTPNKLDTPRCEAYGIRAAVTFTFSGPKVNERRGGRPGRSSDPGLVRGGEIAGGLYYHTQGSGTGLVAGVVFGRFAGEDAARGDGHGVLG